MGPTATLPCRALSKTQRREQTWGCQLSSWLAKMEISICCWSFWVPPFCSQLRWANGENQKTHTFPISSDGAALMLQPPHPYGPLARGCGEKNYKGKPCCLFQVISTVFLWNTVVPSFSLSLGTCMVTQTTTQGGDVPAKVPLALLHPCATAGSVPACTAPCEVIRAFKFQRLYISAIHRGEEVCSSYQGSTQEQFYLHPDRAEKALEPFASVGRSDKGDLTKKRAEELPQPTATHWGIKVFCAAGQHSHIFWRSFKINSQ